MRQEVEPRRLADAHEGPGNLREPPRSLERQTAVKGRGHTQTPLQGSASPKTPGTCAGPQGPGPGRLRQEQGEGGGPDGGSADIPFSPGRMGPKRVSEE